MRYDLKIVKTSIVKWKYLPLNIRMIGVKENCRFIDFSKWRIAWFEKVFRKTAAVKLQGKFTLIAPPAWPLPDACFRMIACFSRGNSYPRRRMSGVFAQAWNSLESKQQFHSGLHGLIFWALIVAGTHAPTCGWHETCK